MKMKKLTAIVMIAVLMLGLFTGCNNGGSDPTAAPTDGNTEKTYQVTFQDQNGAPVANTIILWNFENGSTQLAITGADGVLTLTTADVVTGVTLSSVPEGYSAEKMEYTFSDGAELTVALTADSQTGSDVTYTVTVVDQNGTPVAGVVIQICDEENCKLPMTTDENGTASASYEPSVYHVTLNTLPEGYSSEETEFYFGDATELTITIHAEG